MLLGRPHKVGLRGQELDRRTGLNRDEGLSWLPLERESCSPPFGFDGVSGASNLAGLLMGGPIRRFRSGHFPGSPLLRHARGRSFLLVPGEPKTQDVLQAVRHFRLLLLPLLFSHALAEEAEKPGEEYYQDQRDKTVNYFLGFNLTLQIMSRFRPATIISQNRELFNPVFSHGRFLLK